MNHSRDIEYEKPRSKSTMKRNIRKNNIIKKINQQLVIEKFKEKKIIKLKKIKKQTLKIIRRKMKIYLIKILTVKEKIQFCSLKIKIII